jgi:uncharacterized membrane protein
MVIASIITTLILSFTMLLFGWIFIYKPPKKINGWYGYRTNMSMKNQETWDYAHRVAGHIWLILGVGILPSSILLLLFLKDWVYVEDFIMIQIYVQTALLILVIPLVEILLHKQFKKDGTRK